MEVFLGILAVTLIGFAAFAVLVGFGARKAVKSVEARGAGFEAPPYRHLSVEAGVTIDELIEVMLPYKSAEGVGPRATRLIAQLETIQRKHEHLQSVASGRYAKSAISLDAVTEVMTSADDKVREVLHNSTIIANGVQTFDVANYHALKKQRSAASWRPSISQDAMQIQRLSEMEERLASFDEGLEANESYLLGYDRLLSNLDWLESGSADV